MTGLVQMIKMAMEDDQKVNIQQLMSMALSVLVTIEMLNALNR